MIKKLKTISLKSPPDKGDLGGLKAQSKSVGFVPTMGALHEGHIALIKACQAKAQVSVVSIFVNPAQFGPSEDLDRYPRPTSKDEKILSDLKVDYVFMPKTNEIYPRPPEDCTQVWVPKLSEQHCGITRPKFFPGITTVVCRLLNIVQPDYAFFGEKDYQQLCIIKTMVKDLFIPTEIIGVPTIRSPEGLALSSRNAYLSPDEVTEASNIYKMLQLGLKTFKSSTDQATEITNTMRNYLETKTQIKIDYLVIVDPENLSQKDDCQTKDRILFAGTLNKTRLIDNLALS